MTIYSDKESHQDDGKASHHYDGLPAAGFLRLPEVLRIIPVSRASWWAGVAKGYYPKPVKLSANTTAWSVDSIRELIAHLNAQSAKSIPAAAARSRFTQNRSRNLQVFNLDDSEPITGSQRARPRNCENPG